MSVVSIRRRAKRRIERLSADRLHVADDFLAYLEKRESNRATDELLEIPGLLDELRRAEEEVAKGKVVPVEKVRWKD